MHLTTVKLKNGQTLTGYVWTVCPKEGWFMLVNREHKLAFDDCEAVITEGERVSVNHTEDTDMLLRWKKMARESGIS